MQIAMIGTGYVGLVSGTCFSEFGFNVICVDKDDAKIEKLKSNIIPIYEPGLEALVERNQTAGRLSFTTDLKDAVSRADIVFIAVGTPTRRGDGHADLSYVYSAAKDIAASMSGYTVVVTKSTVPVGTGKQVFEIIKNENSDLEFDVASNPEFLREGSAIDDFIRPDRVVIGTDSSKYTYILDIPGVRGIDTYDDTVSISISATDKAGNPILTESVSQKRYLIVDNTPPKVLFAYKNTTNDLATYENKGKQGDIIRVVAFPDEPIVIRSSVGSFGETALYVAVNLGGL